MAYYYKLDSRRKIISAIDEELEIYLQELRDSQSINYRTAEVPEINFLYLKSGLMSRNIEVVTDGRIPEDFLYSSNWETVEEPREVSKAKYFVMLWDKEGKDFVIHRRYLREMLVGYEPHIEFSAIGLNCCGDFPSVCIMPCSDNAFSIHTKGDILDLVKFADGFSERLKKSKELRLYLRARLGELDFE